MPHVPVPPPNIDLGCTYKVINDSVTPPRWKTIHYGYATMKQAQALIRSYKLEGIWAFEDLTNDSYYIAKA